MTRVTEAVQIERKALGRGSHYSSIRLDTPPAPVMRKITIELPYILCGHRKILSKKMRNRLLLTDRTINILPVPENGSITLQQAVNYFTRRGSESIPEQFALLWDSFFNRCKYILLQNLCQVNN